MRCSLFKGTTISNTSFTVICELYKRPALGRGSRAPIFGGAESPHVLMGLSQSCPTKGRTVLSNSRPYLARGRQVLCDSGRKLQLARHRRNRIRAILHSVAAHEENRTHSLRWNQWTEPQGP